MIIDRGIVDALKQGSVDMVGSLVIAVGILSLHIASSVLIIQIPLALVTVGAGWVIRGHLSVAVGSNLDFSRVATAGRRRCRAESRMGVIGR